MEAAFNSGIQAAGLVASLCARGRRIRCGGIESSVAASRRAKPPARVFAGSTSRPVEFLFRSAMSEPGKDRAGILFAHIAELLRSELQLRICYRGD